MQRWTVLLMSIVISAGFGAYLIQSFKKAEIFVGKQNDTNFCCTDGYYDEASGHCVGENNQVYAFTTPCKKLQNASIFEVDLDLDLEKVDNFCKAGYYQGTKIIKEPDWFICDPLENCCGSNLYDAEHNNCSSEVDEHFYFSLSCGKATSDAAILTEARLISDISEHCFANTTTGSYYLCHKTYYAVKFPFKFWFFPISIVFLIRTIYIYMFKLKELKSPQDTAFKYAITCLTLYMIFYGIRGWTEFLYAYIGRYFKLTYFSWFNAMLFNRVHENLIFHSHVSDLFHPFWSHLYAWTVPFLFIIIYHYFKINMYIPMLIFWLVNLILVFAILISLRFDEEYRKKLIWKRNNYRSWLMIRLFCVAEILWVFGESIRVPTFASLLALQGVLIYLVMVIYRYHAKRKLGGTKCGCFYYPEKWKTVKKVDEDSFEDVEDPVEETEPESPLIDIVKLPF